MIRFQDVRKSFGNGQVRVEALRGLDIEIPAGQMCALMGPSGAGKSTVLHLAAGLTKPDSGTIHVGEHVVSGMTDDELTLLRRRKIGIVVQFFDLLPYMTAYENVAMPLSLDGASRSEEKARVSEALRMVNMAHRRDHRPHELSGGEAQRVAIARAIVISPETILADEPTGNLDSSAGRHIIDLLRDINESLGVTTLVVTHDPVWGASCDRILRLEDGVIDDDISLTPEPE